MLGDAASSKTIFVGGLSTLNMVIRAPKMIPAEDNSRYCLSYAYTVLEDRGLGVDDIADFTSVCIIVSVKDLV